MVGSCKACGTKIDKGVKKCIHCGIDQRNSLGKYTIMSGILAIIIIGGIWFSMSGDKSSATGAPAASTTDTPTTTPDPAEPTEEGVSSDVKISVTGLTSKTSIENNQYGTVKAQGIFRIVSISLTNNQKDALTIDSNYFKLLDDQDREFLYSPEAQIALIPSMSGKQESFFPKEVNPGMTIDLQIVFDVPKDANKFKLNAAGKMTVTQITSKL